MEKKSKKARKKFSALYTIQIVLLIIIIAISLFIILGLEGNYTVKEIIDKVEIISFKDKENEEITEADARRIAVKQFGKLGEKISKKDLNVTKIKRNEDRYYYITSRENTLEIKILGGEITRINSVVVE